MSTQIVPDAATHGPLRSPEQVLATISAIVDRSGLAAPRRLSFDEPRPGEPLAVLSLSWPSVEDMRPWMQVFSIDAHREGATTVTGDYAGWSLMLTAPEPSRVDVAAAEQIPVTVIDVEPDARDLWPAEVVAPIDLVPVTPVLANRSQRSVPEHVDRIPLRVVDITTVDPDLTDVGRGDAEVARMVAPLAVTGDLALEFSHHHRLQAHRVRIDTGGGVWLHVPGEGWARVGEVEPSHLPTAEVDAHAFVESHLKRQPFASEQPSFDVALPRLQAQRDDAAFAEIVSAQAVEVSE